MDQLYKGSGIQFRYPEDWLLQEQGDESEVSVTVQSPGAAFWSIALYRDRPRPEDLLESAIAAFREEYPELDIYEVQAKVCEHPAVACDIDFVCLDLVNSAAIRAFRTGRYSGLILHQSTDAEPDELEQSLEGISRSLICEFGDDVLIG